MTGPGVSLSSVAERLRSAGLLVSQTGSAGTVLGGVAQDSRAVAEGDLFLAWRGTAHDAHDHVGSAAAAGAAAAVVERPLTGTDIPQLRVRDGRAAAALAAERVLGEPGRRLELFGVTGTNGKTTTALLARHLLGSGRATYAMGTLGLVDDAGEVRPGTGGLTTPGPVQVSEWLRELVDGGVEAVVMEASSHALEQRRLDGLLFRTAIFTNLSRDHLDYHGSWEAYFGAKSRLLGLVASGGTAIVNGAVDAWEDLPVGELDVWTYGLDGGVEGGAAELEVGAAQVDYRPDGSRFLLRHRGGEVEVHLPLLGSFNVENALAAAAAALSRGASLESVAEGLATAPQIPGRLERVVSEPFTVLIDFAHTPDALARVVETLRSVSPGRFTVLFGAGGDRDRKKRPLMGAAVAGAADRIVVTSDNPRTENPDSIIDELVEGLEGAEHVRITDREEAIRHVLETAAPGELVLLAGKGHETYQDVAGEKRHFDERAIVGEWMSARQGR